MKSVPLPLWPRQLGDEVAQRVGVGDADAREFEQVSVGGVLLGLTDDRRSVEAAVRASPLGAVRVLAVGIREVQPQPGPGSSSGRAARPRFRPAASVGQVEQVDMVLGVRVDLAVGITNARSMSQVMCRCCGSLPRSQLFIWPMYWVTVKMLPLRPRACRIGQGVIVNVLVRVIEGEPDGVGGQRCALVDVVVHIVAGDRRTSYGPPGSPSARRSCRWSTQLPPPVLGLML